MSRYLTKSRFKLAIECPTKLFYTKKDKYYNQKNDDNFLEALAESGLQIGELAKLSYPDGSEVKSLDDSIALEETNHLLRNNQVSIFEAAIKFENCFIRADILIKNKNIIELIEVKSKSYKNGDENKFHTAVWKKYIHDVAFQKYVLQNAFPDSIVKASLMLVDKDKVCSVEGLFGKFKIEKNKKERKFVTISSNLSEEDKNVDILTKVPVDNHVDTIIQGNGLLYTEKSFADEIKFLSEQYEKDQKINSDLGSKCKKCEFKFPEEKKYKGFKSGFEECWEREAGFTSEDFNEQTVLDLQNFRKTDEVMKKGIFKLKDLPESYIASSDTGNRQKVQIERSINKKTCIDTSGIKDEMDKWQFPLHFIDFETSRPAIPFTRGKKPYEEIAFQFSHHTVEENEKIEHKNQYINLQHSYFPNFDFLRALKKALQNDNGTIFRYWDHENTYLKKIKEQLKNSNESDKNELIIFIDSITKNGTRAMIDLGKDIILKYYYSPKMKGSNSIKKVLPSILSESQFLQNKYSQPIYGTDKIKSLNFKNKIWIQKTLLIHTSF